VTGRKSRAAKTLPGIARLNSSRRELVRRSTEHMTMTNRIDPAKLQTALTA